MLLVGTKIRSGHSSLQNIYKTHLRHNLNQSLIHSLFFAELRNHSVYAGPNMRFYSVIETLPKNLSAYLSYLLTIWWENYSLATLN